MQRTPRIAWTVAPPCSRSPRTTPTTIAGGATATSANAAIRPAAAFDTPAAARIATSATRTAPITVKTAVTRGETSPARRARISVAAASAVISAVCHGPAAATPMAMNSTNRQISSSP